MPEAVIYEPLAKGFKLLASDEAGKLIPESADWLGKD